MCRHVCRHMRRHVLAGPMANLCAVTHVIPIEPPRHFGSKGLSPFQAALHVPEAPPQAPPPRAWCGRVHLCTGVCAVVRSETSNKPLWRAVSVSDFRVPASLATYSSGAIVRHLCIHVWRLFLSGGMAILTVADMEAAGRALQRSTGCRAVLVKGGHMLEVQQRAALASASATAVTDELQQRAALASASAAAVTAGELPPVVSDVLVDGEATYVLTAPRVETDNTHGTGVCPHSLALSRCP